MTETTPYMDWYGTVVLQMGIAKCEAARLLLDVHSQHVQIMPAYDSLYVYVTV